MREQTSKLVTVMPPPARRLTLSMANARKAERTRIRAIAVSDRFHLTDASPFSKETNNDNWYSNKQFRDAVGSVYSGRAYTEHRGLAARLFTLTQLGTITLPR